MLESFAEKTKNNKQPTNVMWYSKKVLFYFRLIFPIFFYGVDSIFVCIFFVFFLYFFCIFFHGLFFFITMDVSRERRFLRKLFGEHVRGANIFLFGPNKLYFTTSTPCTTLSRECLVSTTTGGLIDEDPCELYNPRK